MTSAHPSRLGRALRLMGAVGIAAAAVASAAGSPAGTPGVASAAAPGTAPIGPLTITPSSGDPSTVFAIDGQGGNAADPTNTYCPGDSANDNYRVQTFMTPVAVDPATLTYDDLGPIEPGGSGQTDTQSLYSLTQTQWINQTTSVNPKGFFDPADYPSSLSLWPADFLTDGDYWIGIACTVLGETKTFWSVAVTITGSASGYSYAVLAGAAPEAPTVQPPEAGDGSLQVAFTVPATTNPAVASWTATATPAAGGAAIVQTFSVSPGTITGLTNGTEYSITVTATNSVGTSPASAAVTGTPQLVVPPDSSSSSSSSSTTSTTVTPSSSSSSSSSVAATVQPPSSSSSTTTTSSTSTLPRTGGGNSSGPIIFGAVILLLVGRIIMLVVRTPKILPPRS